MKRTWIVILTLAISYPTIAADAVNWRTDYGKAVAEANATKKLLLLDFGTEACVYCRKLDATTFKDVNVIRLIGERFIPVKLDGERETKIVQALQIDSYPTLIIAAPNGDVLARHPGYLDAAGMTRFLRDALSRQGGAADSAVAVKCESATSLLQQARKDFDDGFHLCCVERCDRLVRLYPNAAEAEQARRLARRALAAGGDEVTDLIVSLRQRESR